MEENNTKVTKPEKKSKLKESTIEIIVAIFLGVTALTTAWASWIGSLHGGNQATNYAKSNNLQAEGNSEYNSGVQNLSQDMNLWNSISDLQLDIWYAQDSGDEETAEKCQWKMEKLMNDNLTEDFGKVVDWAMQQGGDENGDLVSPFTYVYEEDAELSDGTKVPAGTSYEETYFIKANDILQESNDVLEQGKTDNQNGDTFNLVTVIYSVVLFMLGIVGTFKRLPNRVIVLGVAIAGFIFATIFMFTIPMPTGFDFMGYFK